jgi:hypothetical protein
VETLASQPNISPPTNSPSVNLPSVNLPSTNSPPNIQSSSYIQSSPTDLMNKLMEGLNKK